MNADLGSAEPRVDGQNGLRHRRRIDLLRRLEQRLEIPMLVLGLAWLALLIVQLVRGLTPSFRVVGSIMWALFVIDFAVRFLLAPRKLAFLKSDWLMALALVIPALRILRIAQAVSILRTATAFQPARLVKVVVSVNREMHALRVNMGRRRFGYVVALTAIVTFAGAAGMYAFESGGPADQGVKNYGNALWWTAMLLTTVGSEFWPRTPEGRILCLLLSLYSLGVLGYVTASLASFFIGRDAEDDRGEIAGQKQVEAVRNEIAELRREMLDRQRCQVPSVCLLPLVYLAHFPVHSFSSKNLRWKVADP